MRSGLLLLAGVGVALTPACVDDGAFNDVGDVTQSGGRDGGDSGGTSGAEATEGGVLAGGSAGVPAGGLAGAPGGGPAAVVVGGVAGAPAGGSANFGGIAGVGGWAGSAGAPVVPYPWNPTVPIDPTCTCDSANDICNASGQCVPRCDDAGRCALWLVERFIGMELDGSTLYYLTGPSSDPLGNPNGDATLWRVATPDGTPEVVASNLGEVQYLIGRQGDVTYLSGRVLIAVADDGSVERTDLGVNVYGEALAPDAIYIAAREEGLYRLEYGQPGPAEKLLDNDCNSVAVADYVWCLSDFDFDLVMLDPSTMESSVLGHDSDELVGAEDSMVIGRGSSGYEVYGPGGYLRIIFRTDQMTRSYMSAEGGWLYAATLGQELGPFEAQLVRFPITEGRLPEDVLPPDLALAACYGHTNGGYANTDILRFVAGEAGLLWAQPIYDRYEPETHFPQYIFHAPLVPPSL